MEKFQTNKLVSNENGQTHMVSMKGLSSLPGWLVHTQIELDGKRVFVRRVDTAAGSHLNDSDEVFGIVVSPVY